MARVEVETRGPAERRAVERRAPADARVERVVGRDVPAHGGRRMRTGWRVLTVRPARGAGLGTRARRAGAKTVSAAGDNVVPKVDRQVVRTRAPRADGPPAVEAVRAQARRVRGATMDARVELIALSARRGSVGATARRRTATLAADAGAESAAAIGPGKQGLRPADPMVRGARVAQPAAARSARTGSPVARVEADRLARRRGRGEARRAPGLQASRKAGLASGRLTDGMAARPTAGEEPTTRREGARGAAPRLTVPRVPTVADAPRGEHAAPTARAAVGKGLAATAETSAVRARNAAALLAREGNALSNRGSAGPLCRRISTCVNCRAVCVRNCGVCRQRRQRSSGDTC